MEVAAHLALPATPPCGSFNHLTRVARATKSTVVHLKTDSGRPCPSTVSDLWNVSSKSWNANSVSTFFDDSFKDQIMQIPIINADFEDEVCWTHTPNAACTTKSAYKTFLQEQLAASSTTGRSISVQEKDILIQVWKNKSLVPRVKSFAWRLIRRAISSGLRASRFSIHIKKECCRCGMLESDSHIFFHCSFARAFWFKWGIRTDAFDHNAYPSTIIQSLLSSSHLDCSLDKIFTLLWNIWKARNDLFFNKKLWTPMHVHFATKSLLSAGIGESMEEKCLNPMNTSSVSPPSSNVSICPAGPLAYVDAAFNPSQAGNVATTGVWLKLPSSHQSIFVQAIFANVSSVLQAEAHGLLLAASIVNALGWTDVSFLTDCKILAEAAEAKDLLTKPGHWNIRPILANFFHAASSLNSFKVSHIPRILNLIAHSLAKRAFRQRFSSYCSFRCSKVTCKTKMALDAMALPSGRLLSVHCLGC